MDDRIWACIPPWYQPTKSTQPCTLPGSLNHVSALIVWGKGGDITSAGWQITLRDSMRLAANWYTLFTLLTILYLMTGRCMTDTTGRLMCCMQKLQVSQVRLTSTREELIKEQGRLRRQLDKLRRRCRRSVTSSLHSLSESSSTSTSSSLSSLDSGLLETGHSLR